MAYFKCMVRIRGCQGEILFSPQIAEEARLAASFDVDQQTSDRVSKTDATCPRYARLQRRASDKLTSRARLDFCKEARSALNVRCIAEPNVPFAWG